MRDRNLDLLLTLGTETQNHKGLRFVANSENLFIPGWCHMSWGLSAPGPGTLLETLARTPDGEVEALPEASSFQLKSRQALPTPAGQGRQLYPDSASS